MDGWKKGRKDGRKDDGWMMDGWVEGRKDGRKKA